LHAASDLKNPSREETPTVRYMMFIKHPENFRMEDIPPSLFEAMGKLVDESIKNGSMIDTAGLKPTKEGKRVRLSGGKIAVIDGPFTEAKEVVGGYAIVQANSTDEALDMAERFMEVHRVHWPAFEGECELRQIDSGESGQ
jgi:hypothetical protein